MENAKKKQIKKAATWILLAALVAGLAAMPLLAKKEAETDGPRATVHSGTVETGRISTALHGGGTLRTEGVEKVNIPSGVKITEFLVKNGDTVTEGTPLAAVDTVSVMTAITDLTETLEYLQKEIRSAKDEKVDSIIAATAGGRIKKVFAQKGDNVQDVMLRDGALALLSLDGLMAVKIEKKLDLLAGETVTVTLEDETEVTGRVASNLDGVIIITLEDEGYAIGQTVSVATRDGREVGAGELYVYNAWKATAYSGVIKTAPAKEETQVSSGTTLFTLSETDFRGKLEYTSALHREYEELLQKLFKMYNSGTIDAPCDGTVSGVDKDSAHLLSTGGEDYRLELLDTHAGEQGITLMLLSNVVWEKTPEETGSVCDPEKGEDCPETDPQRHDASCLKACRRSRTCTATGAHYPDCLDSCTHGDTPQQCGATRYHHADCIRSCSNGQKEGLCTAKKHNLTCIESCVSSNGSRDCPAVGRHKPSCIESCTHADTADKCEANLYHYPDCIRCCITSDSGTAACPAVKHNGNCFFAGMTYKAKVAIVTAVCSSELVVRWDASGQEYDVEKTVSGWKFAATPDFNVDLLVASGPRVTVANPGAYKIGDVIFVITGYKENRPEWTGISVFMRISGNADLDFDLNLDLEGLLGGLTDQLTGMLMPEIDLEALMGQFAGFGNFGFFAQPPVEEDKLFDLEGSTLMEVSPHETVSLIIHLDQQDIARVRVGQKATVKVEALGEELFEATVTEVSGRGTNRGGSSKFAVKLELPKMPDMLDGMSATASLPMEQKQDVPVIPVAALSEQGAWTVVYTALDEKTGEPANPVAVTVGLSDGTYAEILEGLSAGDTYYYSYYDTLELDTGVEERFTLS